jgi:hypothetical protein
MRYFNPSALRASVSSVAAVTVISLIAYSFESYTAYLHARSAGTTAAVYAPASSDHSSRNG